MKILPLSPSTGGSLPCYLLSLEDVNILIDCSIDTNVWCYGKGRAHAVRVPVLESCLISSLDVILLSNAKNALALPFITEYYGFQGVIYATEPTLSLGRLLMLDLIDQMEHFRRHDIDGQKLTGVEDRMTCLDDISKDIKETLKIDMATWRTMYTRHDVEECIQKITTVSYNNSQNIDGLVRLTPVSSGYCMGGCNWVLESHQERVAFIAASSSATDRHPVPINLEAIERVDIMIVTDVSPRQNPEATADRMLAELCSVISSTLSTSGHVLLPVHSTGTVYDLIDCIHSYLKSTNWGHIPIYFISPIAKKSLEYASNCVGWLCKEKKDKAFTEEGPFVHSVMLRNSLLVPLEQMASPSALASEKQIICLFGDPTLRAGDAPSILRKWGEDPKNAIVFTDPGVDPELALQPYKPLSLKVIHCPVDVRLAYSEVNQLIARCNPGSLMIPEEFLTTEEEIAQNITQQACKILPLKHLVKGAPECQGYTTILRSMTTARSNIVGKSFFKSGKITQQLADSLKMKPVNGKPCCAISAIAVAEKHDVLFHVPCVQSSRSELVESSSLLEVHEGVKRKQNQLKGSKMGGGVGKEEEGGECPSLNLGETPAYVLGQVDPQILLRDLKENGFAHASLSSGGEQGFSIVSLPSIRGKIKCYEGMNRTEVILLQSQEHLPLLQQILFSQLSVLAYHQP